MNRFIENCNEVARTMDINELSSLSLGPEIGRGSGFAFRQLGMLAINQSQDYVGLKIPIELNMDAKIRLIMELSCIGTLLESTPEIIDNLPKFINLVKVQETGHMGLITVDMSHGGKKEVKDIPASIAVRNAFYAPFSHRGGFDDIIDKYECDRTPSFEVDGQEFLLDLTTIPLKIYDMFDDATYKKHFSFVSGTVDSLTHSIPVDSNLAQSLKNLYL